MKTAIGAFVLAVLLFAAGAAALVQARATRRVADAQERLATLQFDSVIAAESTPSGSWWPAERFDNDRPARAAAVSYWRRDYAALTGALPAAGDREPGTDAAVMFYAANARFRAARPSATPTAANRTAAVEQLDAIISAYAEVLRIDPAHADAAYNYEFVSRLRDLMARAKPGGRQPAPAPPADPPADDDLPVGPTLHGHPGGPPPEVAGEQFKTLTPMSFEEREEAEPGQGARPRRRG